MTRLFRRRVRVVVGVVEILAGEGEQIRVSFEVKRSLDRSANTASLTLHNLSKETRDVIEGVVDRFVFEAGYGDDTSVLFCGSQAFVTHTKEGADRVTRVEVTDGQTQMRARVVASYSPGANAKTIASELAARVVLPVRFLPKADTAMAGRLYPGGFAAQGQIGDVLERLATDAEVTVSVQDCRAVFAEKDEPQQTEAIVLAAGSGLIGSPERVLDPAKPKKSLIRGASLIIPGLAPGQKVQVDSDTQSGLFRINAVRFSGDTHGDEFRATWEAQAA